MRRKTFSILGTLILGVGVLAGGFALYIAASFGMLGPALIPRHAYRDKQAAVEQLRQTLHPGMSATDAEKAFTDAHVTTYRPQARFPSVERSRPQSTT